MLRVDKYSPKTLDKVLVHEDIAQNLKKLVSEQDCPHLLFYGPPGSGKKTLIMLLLREMFGASAEKVKVENKTWKVDEPPASVIDSNGAVTGHIISTTIGGKNGEPKQALRFWHSLAINLEAKNPDQILRLTILHVQQGLKLNSLFLIRWM